MEVRQIAFDPHFAVKDEINGFRLRGEGEAASDLTFGEIAQIGDGAVGAPDRHDGIKDPVLGFGRRAGIKDRAVSIQEGEKVVVIIDIDAVGGGGDGIRNIIEIVGVCILDAQIAAAFAARRKHKGSAAVPGVI